MVNMLEERVANLQIQVAQVKERTDAFFTKASVAPGPVAPAATSYPPPLPTSAPAPLRASAQAFLPTTPPLSQDHAINRTGGPVPPAKQEQLVQRAEEPSAWSQGIETAMSFVKSNPFASVGVLLVLTGIGFLFSLLAASNIMPPAMRVFLVAAAGIGVMGIGLWQEPKRGSLAANLQGCAIAAEFLCTLWAYDGYHLVSPLTAFIWMGSLSTAAVGWSFVKKRGLFAFLGILGSLLTPIVASTGAGEFSGLTTYCAWIAAMGLGTAIYLGMPSMASVTLAGISALLGAALHTHSGSTTITTVALIAILAGGTGTAVYWVSEQFHWRSRQQASIVSVMLGLPLAVASFLYLQADISKRSAALLISSIALVYFAQILRVSDRWKGWLLAIGCGLVLVAIGVGFEGPARAIAFSAAAMSVILVARALDRSWAEWIAFGFWLLSVGFGCAGSVDLPLATAGTVALGASFLISTRLGFVYAFLAPVILFYALHRHTGYSDHTYFAVVWAWAAAALWLTRRYTWPALLLAAVWIVPATIYFCLNVGITSGWSVLVREALLCSGIIMSAAYVGAWRKAQNFARLRISDASAAWLLMAAPLLLSAEIFRLTLHYGMSSDWRGAVLALMWSIWTMVAALINRRLPALSQTMVADCIASILISMAIVENRPGIVVEAMQVSGIGILWLSLRTLGTDAPRKANAVIYLLTGAAVIGTIMRGVGTTYGLHESLLKLVSTRGMQPWVSILWAAAGIATIVFSSRTVSRPMWMAGGASILVLLLKMFVIDLATFTLIAKVSVFLVMGVAFIALGAFCPLPPDASKTVEHRPI